MFLVMCLNDSQLWLVEVTSRYYEVYLWDQICIRSWSIILLGSCGVMLRHESWSRLDQAFAWIMIYHQLDHQEKTRVHTWKLRMHWKITSVFFVAIMFTPQWVFTWYIISTGERHHVGFGESVNGVLIRLFSFNITFWYAWFSKSKGFWTKPIIKVPFYDIHG